MASKIQQDAFKVIFFNNPAAMLIIDIDAPDYTVIDANKAYLNATNTEAATIIGRSVFAAFPANPTDEDSKNIERTIFSFEQAIQTKTPHTMSFYRYDIPIRGTADFEERYWTTTNTPVLDANGEVLYFIHSPANVTEMFKLREREQHGLKALKLQKEQLYATFMQAPVGIAILRGPDYVVDLVNPPLCELYGKSMRDLSGKPIFNVLTHASGHGFEELLDSVRLTGVPFKGQGLMVPLFRNNTLENVYVNFVYEPFREDDGSISGVIVVATDVTEQITAKQQLEEAEERGRLAVDAVGLGTFDLNLETGEMITSTLFTKIFGFDSVVHRDAYVSVIHPDDRNAREEAHKQAIKSGRLFYEARVLWKDGSLHWIRVEGKTYYNPSAEAVRILGTLLDITEQKEAKEQQHKLLALIKESEHLLRSITSAAPTGLWMADEEGEITYVNQTWVDWTGISFEDQLGAGWLHTIIEEDREKAAAKFRNDLSARSFYEVEFRINHTDSAIHWCVANGRPQYRDDGSFAGYIGACVDITEQKNLQRQKDDFIGIASHELKTPVTSIKAYAQVLERMLEKKGETKETDMIRRMDGQINRLTSLIGDLLDVTKINSGKLQFNDRDFDFNEHIFQLIEDLQLTTERHMLIKEFNDTGIVFGDKERIGQVVTNLVTNAIKYSPHADKIIIGIENKNNEAILCVQDFGIGIASKNMDRVFEQFYRVSGDKQHTFPGLGLGLYISSEIIKREGGRIWVTSAPGEGSSFYFSLPLKK
jgi:PAS domain S-box-containing protein